MLLQTLRFLLFSTSALAQSWNNEYPIKPPEDSISILYNGTVTGTYTAPPSANNCITYHLGSYEKSYFTLGRNPPWDPNPFFFQLDHDATEYDGGFYTTTADSIWILWSLSADRVTNSGYDAGQRCSQCAASQKVAVRVWDLSAAKIAKFNDTNGEMGYNITGDQSTFLGKGAIDRVSVEITPLHYLNDWQKQYDRGCVGGTPGNIEDENSMEFNWTTSANPTYTIAISNTTANVSMTLNNSFGFLTLFFTGKRLDYPFSQSNYNQSESDTLYIPSSGNFNNDTIQLDTSNPAMPNFTFTNGSRFGFVPEYEDDPDYSWQPLAEGVSRGNNTANSTNSTTGKPNNAQIFGAWGSWEWSWWILGLLGVFAFM